MKLKSAEEMQGKSRYLLLYNKGQILARFDYAGQNLACAALSAQIAVAGRVRRYYCMNRGCDVALRTRPPARIAPSLFPLLYICK